MNDVYDEPADLLELMETTRAIRRFRPDEIPDADLARMFFAATRAPSASNRQHFRFLLLRRGRDDTARSLLGAEYRAQWSRKSERDGYGDAARSRAPGSRMARMTRAMTEFVDNFESIPLVVLPCLIRYQDPSPLEGASVFPACQNLLLAARALGYGGVMTQWHLGVEDELRGVLGIPDGVALCGVIALGRPVGRHGPVRRMPLQEFIYESKWAAGADWASDPEGTVFTSAGPPQREMSR